MIDSILLFYHTRNILRRENGAYLKRHEELDMWDKRSLMGEKSSHFFHILCVEQDEHAVLPPDDCL